jgi:hypothetical protein
MLVVECTDPIFMGTSPFDKNQDAYSQGVMIRYAASVRRIVVK